MLHLQKESSSLLWPPAVTYWEKLDWRPGSVWSIVNGWNVPFLTGCSRKGFVLRSAARCSRDGGFFSQETGWFCSIGHLAYYSSDFFLQMFDQKLQVAKLVWRQNVSIGHRWKIIFKIKASKMLQSVETKNIDKKERVRTKRDAKKTNLILRLQQN